MKHVIDNMAAYLAGELAADESARLERHCADCPACSAELEEMRRAWDLMETAAVEVPRNPRLWEAVRERTVAREAWFFGARPWVRRGWATGAVAAGLMMGVLLPGAFSPGEAEADPLDPVLSGSTWAGEGSTELSDWWLVEAAAETVEEDR